MRLIKLDENRLVLMHPKTGRFYITEAGIRDVERRNPARPV